MKDYIDELKEVLDGLDLGKIREAIQLINQTYNWAKIVYTCGNGGSAATASHLTCDLVKNCKPGIQSICLNDNAPLMTALANDSAYEHIFAGYLSVMRPGALVAISTSGNSPNVLTAVEVYKNRNTYPVIALTGRDGGELGRLADVEIRVPSDRIQIIEDVHLSICHMIAVGLGA